MSNFQQPAIANPDDKFVAAENNGALLLFFPTEFKTGVATVHDDSDAVAARIVRLNDGRVYENALIFPKALVTQLKAAVPDGMVLGTLGQGQNTKGNPPWLLSPHTAEDVAKAEAWLAANPRQQQPAPAAPPTQNAWNAQATPAAPAWGGQAAAPAPAGGGWGNPPAPSPAQAGGWGAPAPAASSAAPASGGWGAPAAPAPQIDPGLVAALGARGVAPEQLTSQAQAEQIAATLGLVKG